MRMLLPHLPPLGHHDLLSVESHTTIAPTDPACAILAYQWTYSTTNRKCRVYGLELYHANTRSMIDQMDEALSSTMRIHEV
jgi:hypothetical protein